MLRRLPLVALLCRSALAVSLLACAVTPVQAQSLAPAQDQRPATIPLEVAFIYSRLLNVAPDFNLLATNSPKLQNTPEFGRDALIAQERHTLESIFKTVKRDSLIVIRDHFAIDTIAPSLQNIQFKNIDADMPFNFDVGTTTYGVFIRNAPTIVMPVQAPFYKGGDWVTLQKMSLDRQEPLIELTLQPLGADGSDFTTFKDQTVKPIIADLIEIKVYDPTDPTKLLLDKRDEKAFAKASSQLENLVQDDLRDDALGITGGSESMLPNGPIQ